MAVHLVKMAVGIESIDHLKDVQADRLRRAREADPEGSLRHLTRNTPRRSDEVLDGGSIYWVIKGYIRVRQRIVGFGEAVGRTGKPRCAIILDPELVRTELVPHKPMQGWRYMEDEAAPEDLAEGELPETTLPDEMAAELRALGLL